MCLKGPGLFNIYYFDVLLNITTGMTPMIMTLYVTKALSDGNRLRTVAALLEHDELCVCQITEMLGLAPGTVSRHMGVLQNARLVESRKDGRWVHYRLSGSFPILVRQWLAQELSQAGVIAEDRVKLDAVIAADREDLCRSQRKRKCHSG